MGHTAMHGLGNDSVKVRMHGWSEVKRGNQCGRTCSRALSLRSPYVCSTCSPAAMSLAALRLKKLLTCLPSDMDEFSLSSNSGKKKLASWQCNARGKLEDGGEIEPCQQISLG